MPAAEHASLPERELRETIAANLKKLIADRGQTVIAVSGLAAMSRSHLDYVLNCEKAPTSDVLARLAEALDVEPWQLLLPKNG